MHNYSIVTRNKGGEKVKSDRGHVVSDSTFTYGSNKVSLFKY